MSGTDCISVRLTVAEVCAILKECHQSKVMRLTFEGLDVAFFENTLVDRPGEDANLLWSQPTNPPVKEAISQDQDTESEDIDLSAVIQEEGGADVLEELRRYELMTNDPVAFEQEMIDQQLERDSEGEEDNAKVRSWRIE